MKTRVLTFTLTLSLILALIPPAAAVPTGYVEIVAPMYDVVTDFEDGVAMVGAGSWETGYKWGYVDSTGKEIVPPVYDEISYFTEGIARIRVRDSGTDKWGFVDQTGKEIVPPIYDEVWDFRDGLAEVAFGDYWVTGQFWGVVDKTGKVIVDVIYRYVYIDDDCVWARLGDWETGTFHFFDKTGKEIEPPDYADDEDDEEYVYLYDPDAFDDKGLYMFSSFEEMEAGIFLAHDTYKEGLFDRDANMLTPRMYDFIGLFRDGLAIVALGVWPDRRLYGLIDTAGKEVVPPKYDQIEDFHDGLALVRIGEDYAGLDVKYGFIDMTGKEIVPLEYDYANSFSEGLAVVSKLQEVTETLDDGSFNGWWKWGFIDTSGQVAIPLIYENARSFSGGLAAVNSNLWPGGWALIDKTGKAVTPFVHTMISDYSPDNGYALAQVINGYLCLYDGAGEEILHITQEYDYMEFSTEGMVKVYKGPMYESNYFVEYKDPYPSVGKWGYISLLDDAADSVNVAIAAGIVPQELQGMYTAEITRGEFCALAVAIYEKHMGKAIAEHKTFPDTADPNVEKMAGLGVVTGSGSGFDPDGVFNRQMAARLLVNLLEAVGVDIPKTPTTFDDQNLMASWAVEPIGQVQAAGLITGSGNSYNPQDTLTREAAMLLMLDVWDYLKRP